MRVQTHVNVAICLIRPIRYSVHLKCQNKPKSKMQKIVLILQQNDDKRGTSEWPSPNPLVFDDILSIGLFTTDSAFCSQFQSDRRNHRCGCKWSHMESRFQSALFGLHFAQKMGRLEMSDLV